MANKIRIICIGKIKEIYIKEGVNEFLKRLRPYCSVNIIELKDEGIEKEAKKLEPYIGQTTYVLDSAGKQFSSEEFSHIIKKTEQEITFIIGGPEGVSEIIKSKAKLLSLSRMTFLHEMVRLVLMEQVYRAYMIIANRKYHK